MNTDAIGSIVAMQAAGQSAQINADYSAAVLKKSLDAQKSESAQLLASLDPNLGNNLDVKG